MTVGDWNTSAILSHTSALIFMSWGRCPYCEQCVLLTVLTERMDLALRLSCEVERCIVRDEPDPPLLPKTVDGRC